MTINEWMARRKTSAGAATAFGDLAQRRSARRPEMNAYQELKSSIHRQAHRPAGPVLRRRHLPGATLGDHQDRRGRTHHRRGDPAHPAGAGSARRRDPARDHGAGAAGAAPSGSRDLRHHGQRAARECLRRDSTGRSQKTEVTFKDDEHLMTVIERIVSKVGRRVDESSPMVDARLADGSRVNVIIPPLASTGRRSRSGGSASKPAPDGEPPRQRLPDGGDGRRVRGDGAGADEHPGLRRDGRGQDDAC